MANRGNSGKGRKYVRAGFFTLSRSGRSLVWVHGDTVYIVFLAQLISFLRGQLARLPIYTVKYQGRKSMYTPEEIGGEKRHE